MALEVLHGSTPVWPVNKANTYSLQNRRAVITQLKTSQLQMIF